MPPEQLPGKAITGNRPTIGFFNITIEEEWALWPWQGVMDAARKQDVNVITYVGKTIRWSPRFEEQANIAYALADGGYLDGLIIWKAGLTLELSEAETEALCNRYHVPVVTLEGAVRGRPCVTYSNYQAMKAIIDHLVEVHGYRRIGFMGSHAHHVGFRERHRSYVETMAAHGLAVDPRIDLPFLPFEVSAYANIRDQAVGEWFEQAIQFEPEALIGVTDNVSLRLMRLAQEHGRCVPGDLAVAGFDGFIESRCGIPPLTTVRPSWYDLGYSAVDTLVDLIAGRPVPEQVLVPYQLLLRQSCGCGSAAVALAGRALARVRRKKGPLMLTAGRAALVAEIMAVVGESAAKAQLAGDLIDGLQVELKGERGVFLRALEAGLRQIVVMAGDVGAWQGGLSVLRCRVAPHLGSRPARRLETVWEQARVMVGEFAAQAELAAGAAARRRASALWQLAAQLSTAFAVKTLVEALAGGLPRLGIRSGYLARYEDPRAYAYPDPVPAQARLLLAYTERGRVPLEEGGRRFATSELVPPELWPVGRSCAYVVVPLYFQTDQLGYLVLEVGPADGALYEAFQAMVSSALKGALLVEERQGRLRLAEVQQAALLDNLPFLAWMKDAGGYFLAVNEPFSQACGLPGEAIIGKTDREVWPYARAEKNRAADREVMLQRHKKLVEEPLDEPAGTRWFEIYRAPVLDDAGQVIGTVGLARDITDRKQIEAEIRRLNEELEQRVQDRTAQLKASNRELEAFAYSVSHDLRAPLRGIDGYSHALLEDNYAQLDEVGRGYLQHIREASQRMGNLIDDLLNLSRLARCELKRRPVDLSALARGVAETLVQAEPGRTVEWQLAEGLTAQADENLIRAVLENLLGNAWKFTGQRNPARIEFGVQPQPDGALAYYVRDNGAGFDMAYANKLFGVFQRLHTVREFPGTGVGLASVQRIIHRHGGQVWAEGAVEQGATFYFTLPA